MNRGMVDLISLALAGIAAVALMLKLFWPKGGQVPDASDNWSQHNELRSPSFENSGQSRDNSIDAAVLSQIVGD
jgi:hypothetical protein